MRKSTERKMKADRQAYLHRMALEQEQRKAEAQLRSMFRSAIHEAGHAVATEVLMGGVELVTIREELKVIDGKLYVSSGFSRPRSEGRPQLVNREALHTELVVAFAGLVAERGVMTEEETKDYNPLHHDSDTALAHGLCTHMKVFDADRHEIFDTALSACCDFVNANKHSIEAVAEALLERTRLSGEEVSAIVRMSREGVAA